MKLNLSGNLFDVIIIIICQSCWNKPLRQLGITGKKGTASTGMCVIHCSIKIFWRRLKNIFYQYADHTLYSALLQSLTSHYTPFYVAFCYSNFLWIRRRGMIENSLFTSISYKYVSFTKWMYGLCMFAVCVKCKREFFRRLSKRRCLVFILKRVDVGVLHFIIAY